MDSLELRAGNIVESLLAVKTIVKIYHFQTPSYARHKASDKLFATLTATLDQFMEVLQGAWKVRVRMRPGAAIPLINTNDKMIVTVLEEFSSWLIDTVPRLIRPQDTELLNIRDEILSAVSQTLYLFTFQ